MKRNGTTRYDRLPVRDEDGSYLAVIEARQGSRNKHKYNPEHGVFELDRVLPVGTAFPLDFGFIPSTLGDDGDPLDVLVFMDEAVDPGTVVPCRLLGVIEAEQRKKGGRAKRNDRLLAVATHTHQYRHWTDLADLDREVITEIERFFVFYNQQKGVRFTPLDRRGAKVARKLVTRGKKACQAKGAA
jgi:inorganic pyrophosphatase